jgi:prepilin-type N-terminal cleavage/methylation domain-containing protein
MTRRLSVRRGAFTLIELLVVIAIIAILAALTMAAVQKVRERGRDVQARSDITQLEAACAAFKAKFGIFPPCFGDGSGGTFRLATSYGTNSSGGFVYATGFNAQSPEIVALKQMFPRIELASNAASGGNGLLLGGAGGTAIAPNQPLLLDANQCLTFFLSGGSFMGYAGFSTNPQTPFSPPNNSSTSASRLNNGPFFEGFTTARTITPTNYFQNTPGKGSDRGFGNATTDRGMSEPWFVDPWGTPYYYIASNLGNDYPFDSTHPTKTGTYGVKPFDGFRPARDTTGGNRYFNVKTLQIFSAGRNTNFGKGGAYSSGTGVYSLNRDGGDDWSNYQQVPLGVTE